MARNQRLMPVAPERVFAVLADPSSYGHWVVGSDTVRDADETWPAKGSRFHHRVGFGLLKVNDHTEVVEVDPPRRLVLHAKARPLFGTACVALDLERRGGGTLVTMVEDPGDRLTKMVFWGPAHLVVRARNAESLRRLEELALARGARAPATV